MSNLLLISANQSEIETSSAGWVAQTNCAIAQSATFAHTGTNSLRLTSTAGGDMAAVTTPATSVPVGPGRTISFSAWFRSAVSARTCNLLLNWFQSDGVTASVIRATDTAAGSDASGSWTQTALGSVVAPLDAFYVQVVAQVKATGAGAEVHYVDTILCNDVAAPFFKHGRTAMLWLDGKDVSPFFASADWAAKVAAADVTVFQNAWKNFIPGQGESTLTASGYYDSALTNVRATFQQIPPIPVVTYLPAGAFAVGDQARLIQGNTTDYKEGSKIGGAVTMDWTVGSSAIPDWGEVLHVMQSENTGTITGTGTPLLQGISTTTGAVAHLHVTIPGGVQNFKLQDAIALNGAYVDIAGGAFAAQSTAGSQRLIIPGTIRAYVRAVATLITAPCTYAIAVART